MKVLFLLRCMPVVAPKRHQPPATEGPLTEVLRKRVCLVPEPPPMT
jgi:hypothetical protein